MKKKILIFFLTFLFIILQFSLNIKNIRVNLLLMFIVYLLFFEDVNDALIVVALGLIADLFTFNFGSYFVSLLLVVTLLDYIYHNILGNNKLFSYLLINFLALVIFYSSYYVYNLFIKIISNSFYFLEWSVILKNFLISSLFHLIISLLLYFLVNTFSYKIRKKFTLIAG